MSIIELGKGVMLQGEGKTLKYICASKKKEEFTRKHSFNSDCLLGKYYGTAFQIKADGNLEVIDPMLVDDPDAELLSENQDDDGETKDNRNIDDVADSQNQKLTKEDIISLQEEGVSGKEIIQELIENSSTFNERTEFSKMKYLKKKKKKYVPQFLALKPTSRLLSQMYFFRNPLKILSIRPDTLAQVLTWSNVQADSKILVFENCQGLIAGSVLERLGAGGKLIQLYRESSFPVRQIMEQFNFSASRVDENMCSIPLDKIEMLKAMFEGGKTDDEILEILLGKNALQLDVEKDKSVNSSKTPKEDETENMPEKKKRKYDKYKKQQEINKITSMSKMQRLKESRAALPLFRANDIHGLIIASKYHPRNVLITLVKMLPPSRPFVVYFPYKEPLMECYVALKELNVAIDVQVTESWFRDITVLPNRTHPLNIMSGSGGYILHGMKVAS